MALHGSISVNGLQVGWWSARRTERLQSEDHEHEYEATVVWPTSPQRRFSTTLTHRYSDGATALAAKVLAAAAPHAPKHKAPGWQLPEFESDWLDADI